MADSSDRPKVGVGVIIHDSTGSIIMGERAGSHGAGTLQCPGGHLEHGESFADTAIREVREETGLEVGNVKFLTATNDVFEQEEGGEGGKKKHYVTVFVTCSIVGENRTPMPLEPTKCASWSWVPWTQMWAWAKAQAEAEAASRPVEKELFLPLVNLYREYPELENCLAGGGRGGGRGERKESVQEGISGWESRHW